MATWKTVIELAGKLPEVEESTSYGTPCIKVKGRLIARLREEGDTIAVPTDEKDALMASSPDVSFSTPHYDGYPMVLVQLPKIRKAELREVLTDAWRMRAPAKVQREHPDL